jgi:hypothetical protein
MPGESRFKMGRVDDPLMLPSATQMTGNQFRSICPPSSERSPDDMRVLLLLTDAVGVFDGDLRFADPPKSVDRLLRQHHAASRRRLLWVPNREALRQVLKEILASGKMAIAPIQNGPEGPGGSLTDSFFSIYEVKKRRKEGKREEY